jgi:hypothetical protein
MIDDWRHAAPLGVLGWVADRLLLAPLMARLLTKRNAVIREESESPPT